MNKQYNQCSKLGIFNFELPLYCILLCILDKKKKNQKVRLFSFYVLFISLLDNFLNLK